MVDQNSPVTRKSCLFNACETTEGHTLVYQTSSPWIGPRRPTTKEDLDANLSRPVSQAPQAGGNSVSDVDPGGGVRQQRVNLVLGRHRPDRRARQPDLDP